MIAPAFKQDVFWYCQGGLLNKLDYSHICTILEVYFNLQKLT